MSTAYVLAIVDSATGYPLKIGVFSSSQITINLNQRIHVVKEFQADSFDKAQRTATNWLRRGSGAHEQRLMHQRYGSRFASRTRR